MLSNVTFAIVTLKATVCSSTLPSSSSIVRVGPHERRQHDAVAGRIADRQVVQIWISGAADTDPPRRGRNSLESAIDCEVCHFVLIGDCYRVPQCCHDEWPGGIRCARRRLRNRNRSLFLRDDEMFDPVAFTQEPLFRQQ